MTERDDRRGRFHLLAIDDPAEAAMSAEIIERLAQLPIIVERYGRVAGVTPKPGSELADDDLKTAWLQTSHMVSVCMAMAIDNLEAFRSLVEPEPGHLVLRQSAHFPLLRSALESGSLALWLLHPDEQRARIVRLLQSRWSDVKFAHTLATTTAAGFGSATREQRSMAERTRRDASRLKKKYISQIELIAQAQGIAEEEYNEGLPSYGTVIRDATDSTGLNGVLTDGLWRMISGFTHPSALRTAHFGTHQRIQENDDGTDFVLTATNVGLVQIALMSAMTNVATATELLGARSLRPSGNTPRSATDVH